MGYPAARLPSQMAGIAKSGRKKITAHPARFARRDRSCAPAPARSALPAAIARPCEFGAAAGGNRRRPFPRAHRALKLRRIGSAAAEVAGQGGAALCAVVAPHAASRRALRGTVEAVGVVVEVHLSTPLETCEARDPWALYARARAGLVGRVTSVDDPCEPPPSPDHAVDVTDIRPAAVRRVFAVLQGRGYVA